jgi:hypothetical protein
MNTIPLLFLLVLSLGCGRSNSGDDEPTANAPLGTFTRVTMLGRVLEDGRRTSGTEVLVVFPDRRAQIHDHDPDGVLLAQGTVEGEPFVALEEALAHPEWSSLAPERGPSVPDGPTTVIEVRGSRITRHDNPADEIIVRRATAAFEEIWTQIDP